MIIRLLPNPKSNTEIVTGTTGITQTRLEPKEPHSRDPGFPMHLTCICDHCLMSLIVNWLFVR